MRVATSILLLVIAVEAGAAPAPFVRREKPVRDGSFEIDFGPLDDLPAGKYSWHFEVGLHTTERSGPTIHIFGRKERISAKFMAELLNEAITARPEKWLSSRLHSGKRVLLKGMDSPLRPVEVTLTGLPGSVKPSVRWLR